MSLFAIIFALLLEQVRPLNQRSAVSRAALHWLRFCRRVFDAGAASHAVLVGCCAVLLPALLAFAMHWFLFHHWGWFGALLGFTWHLIVLYATLGFRQFSHHYTEIREAISADDLSLTTERLAQWMRAPTHQIASEQIIEGLMKHASVVAHQHVLGTLLMYTLFAALGLGPLGAVLYRMSELTAHYFATANRASANTEALKNESLERFALKTWHWVDYWPARVTALGFAVVGHFENVLEAWRGHLASAQNAEQNDALIQASMYAALNISNHGQALNMAHLQQLADLVWRCMLLWLLLILLLTLARLLG